MKLRTMFLTIIVALLVVPVLAQDRDPRDRTLTFDDFSLTFHRVIARNVSITEYAGDDPAFGPGFSDAPHFNVTLYNEVTHPESLVDTVASIRVYSRSDLQDYPFLVEQVNELAALLEEKPDLTEVLTSDTGSSVPYVPVLPHGQLINARAQYVETDEVRGITFITHSNAAQEPFMSNVFTYTFQGLSADGEYYVSATMPLETGLFPSEADSNFDMTEFQAAWPEYLAASVATLNNASPEDFEPSLGVLDGLIATFEFAGN